MTQGKPVIRKVAVLGAGVMGAQIAAHFANAGFEVVLLDLPSAHGNRNQGVQTAWTKALKLSPAPLADASFSDRVVIGNFEDDWDLLKSCDWILEAIIEKLDIKRALWSKVIETAPQHAILSTNTSGLPVSAISERFPAKAKRRFLGTHFFNPPRYLRLFEIIPTPVTDESIVETVAELARVRLGKGTVVAKDTPNFIANRIGTYAMLGHIAGLELGLSIADIDFLTGPVTGRPKSATFRTADVVGLDTLMHVCKNLYDSIPEDAARDRFKPHHLLTDLVSSGRLGAKTRAGFYMKKGDELLTVSQDGKSYEPAVQEIEPHVFVLSKERSAVKRWQALFSDPGKAGAFIRQTTADTLWYAAMRIPEISDSPEDIDKAIRWGFGWEQGPFEIWDMIGMDRILQEFERLERPVPPFVSRLLETGRNSFYADKRSAVFTVSGDVAVKNHSDEWSVRLRNGADVWSNAEAGLVDIGDSIVLFEFRSKANTLGHQVVAGLVEAVNILESGPWKGMVIGNDGANFTVGANLAEMAGILQAGQFDKVDQAVQHFQQMVQRIRYASKPVVAAIRGKTLGGGCEISMACAGVAASLESYVGLVELAAGIMPAGTGTMHFAWRAASKAASDFPSHIQPFLIKSFETVATAKVSSSAFEAIDLGYLPENTTVVMHDDRRLEVAKQMVLGLSAAGYIAPPKRNFIPVLGKNGAAALNSAAWQMQQAGMASEYDRFLAERFAYILTGGTLTGPSRVSEQYLLDLEREVFCALLKEPKTQERIAGILTNNKPVRN